MAPTTRRQETDENAAAPDTQPQPPPTGAANEPNTGEEDIDARIEAAMKRKQQAEKLAKLAGTEWRYRAIKAVH